MSAEVRPISPTRFAEAVQDLPIENMYAKAHEINNSIAHLQRSNAQLQEYSDSIKHDTSLEEIVRAEGDKDCLEAIRENAVVIARQLSRIGLLKQEVVRRGGRWHEADGRVTTQDGTRSNGAATTNGNGTTSNPDAEVQPQSRPRLTDEELRRRLQEQMGEDDEEDGMHL